jgi:non-specific serine/threonine protein kinase
LQRWERGDGAPDSQIEEALLALCHQLGLFRAYDHGPLRGVDVTPDWLQRLLADARLGVRTESATPIHANVAAAAVPQAIESIPRLPPPPNLPTPLTGLIGRQRELVEAQSLLATTRILTLVGTGGVGKTRLALEIAAAMSDHPDADVCFVSLGPLTDPAMVLPTIAGTLGLNLRGERPVLDVLAEYLRDRELLLVLDNFEHVVTAAPQVVDLCARCPRLKLLVTSRMGLHVRGEREFVVPPLAVPGSPEPATVDSVAKYAAIALFVERAQAVAGAFALTPENAATVAAICRRLDGLPLAIELAAARAKVLSPAELLERLNAGFTILTNGPRDLPARQQTLQNAIAWSYDLLPAEQQALFRRLAVFAGGCTLAAAEAICSADHELGFETLDGLSALVDMSLLQRVEGSEAGPRFQMLQTVRDFAVEQLNRSDEAAAMQAAHLRYLRRLSVPTRDGVLDAGYMLWLRPMAAEIDNIRAALAWSLQQPDARYDGLALAGALGAFWAKAHLREGCEWLERFLAADAGAGRPARAGALLTAAQLLIYQHDLSAARRCIHECLDLSRSLGRKAMLVQALCLLGEMYRTNLSEARAAAREAVALAIELSDPAALLRAYFALGAALCWEGDLAAARGAFEESVAWGRRSSIPFMTGAPLRGLGLVTYREGDYAAARRLIEQSIELLGALDSDAVTAEAFPLLGRVALAEGKLEEAERWFRRTLATAREAESMSFVASALSGLAALALARGDAARAARLCGAADAIGEGTLSPKGEAFLGETEALRARLRGQPGAGVAMAWEEGRTISLQQALSSDL